MMGRIYFRVGKKKHIFSFLIALGAGSFARVLRECGCPLRFPVVLRGSPLRARPWQGCRDLRETPRTPSHAAQRGTTGSRNGEPPRDNGRRKWEMPRLWTLKQYVAKKHLHINWIYTFSPQSLWKHSVGHLQTIAMKIIFVLSKKMLQNKDVYL